jgi:hypothetical protein
MANGMFDEIGEMDLFDKGVPSTRGVSTVIRETSSVKIPTDLLLDTPKQIEFFLDFSNKFGEKIAGKGEAVGKWLNVLGRYAVGDAELSELEAVDVSGLMDIEGFEDYYYGIVPRPLTEDTEEKDPRLLEAIQTYGQEAVDDALAKIQELEAILGKAIDDPFGTLEGIITSTASGTRSCSSMGPEDWWLDCVTVGVTLPFPLPLPGPLGGIFKGATVRDVVETVQNAGHEIGKVLRGETSVEEVLDDLGEWIGEKVQGVLGDDEKGTITIESVLGAIGGFLPNVAAGVIWSTFQNQIENKIGLPILLTTEDGTEDSRCRDAEGNLTPWGERNPTSCGQPVTFEESDLFGTGGLDSTLECTEGTLDTKGNCVCPDGTLEDIDGKCADTVVDPEVDPRCSNPAFAARNPSLCGGQTTYTEGPGFGFGGQPPETRCTDVNATVNEDGSCGDCESGFTKDPNTGKCVPSGNGGNGGGGGETDPCDTITDANAEECNKKKCSDGSFVDANADCPGSGGPGCKPKGEVLESGCDGTTFFARYADGECGEIYDSVPNYAGCGGGEDKCTGGKVRVNGECVCPSGTTEVNGQCVSVGGGGGDGGGTTTTGCSNGATEESGCDTCPDGTSVLEHEDGICPSVSPPLDCSNPAYAAANPQECGTGPECIDCTCAEYAAANPEECGTAPPPETTSGGGGGGGGGGGADGMFTGVVSGLSYTPQILPSVETPPDVNAMASLEGLIGRMLTGNIS